MKVREWIEVLKRMPQDGELLLPDDGNKWCVAVGETLYLTRECTHGDDQIFEEAFRNGQLKFVD